MLQSSTRDASTDPLTGIGVFVLHLAGVTLGLGIWAMHFIAMLSHALSAPSDVFASARPRIDFFWRLPDASSRSLSSARNQTRPTLFIAASVMGSGIASMHYVGMASIRGASVTHDVRFILLAFFVCGRGVVRRIVARIFLEICVQEPPV